MNRFQSRFCTRRQAARRGSALLLAVVIVVLLTMMGAAYLQVARTDRRTSVDVDTRANTDNSSILRYIAQVLAADVPVTPDSTEPEPYDFPWTSPGVPTDPADRWIVPDRFAPLVVPGPEPDFGTDYNNRPAREPRASGDVTDASTPGRLYAESSGGDDPWLASTEPVFTGPNTGTWPQVSNLLGIFLDLRQSELLPPDADGNVYPRQYLSTTGTDIESTVSDLDLTAMDADLLASTGNANLGGLFADADGDGVADSRWTWAPLPSDGGRAYVMAVRIVDNSALVNANAWSMPEATLANGPRWTWPGELSLELALDAIRTRGGAGGGIPDAASVLADTTLRSLTGTGSVSRYNDWLRTTSTRGGTRNDPGRYLLIGTGLERDTAAGTPAPEDLTPAGPFTSKLMNVRREELEFRWKNGLGRDDDNVAPANAATALEDLASVFFRGGATEQDYGDTGYGTVQAFFENEPRKAITTLSGSGNRGRVDLNTADADDIADTFSAPLAYDATNPRQPALFEQTDWLSGFTGGTPEENYNDAKGAFGNQFAALAKDFIDDDRALQRVGNALGMEKLPVISEVHAHVQYRATTVAPGAPDDQVTFTRQPDAYAMAIEFVNPWATPILLTGIDVEFDGRVLGELSTLLGQDTLLGHQIAVYRVEGSLSAVAPPTAAGGPATRPTIEPPVVVAADADFPLDEAAFNRSRPLRMLIEDSDGNDIAYQSLEGFGFEEVATNQPFATGTVAVGDDRWVFTRLTGSANGLNALTVRNVDFEEEVLTGVNGSGVDTRFALQTDQPAGTLGDSGKGATSTSADVASSALDDLDTRLLDAREVGGAVVPGQEPWTIGNGGRMHRTGDLLRLVFVGPRPLLGGGVQPMAEAWLIGHLNANGNGTRINLADRMIDLADIALVDDAPASTPGTPEAVNFASAWMHRFSADLPDSAALVQGRINLNTVPERILASALPMPTQSERDSLANHIVTRRESPGAAPARSGRVGLATVGELVAGAAGVTAMLDITRNNTELVDFNETEMEPLASLAASGLQAGVATADGYTGDREERDRLVTYLNQVASTRSDIYTAYVLVRAYPVTDFSVAPVDEYRLLAIFDRSNVTDRNPTARIVAAVKLDDN